MYQRCSVFDPNAYGAGIVSGNIFHAIKEEPIFQPHSRHGTSIHEGTLRYDGHAPDSNPEDTHNRALANIAAAGIVRRNSYFRAAAGG